MNADKITLPDFLIADLYKSCLVLSDSPVVEKRPLAEEKAASSEAVTSSNKIRFVGQNLKNIVVIVNQANSADLNKSDVTFLTNILKACQLNINDIAIVNIAKQQITYSQTKEELSAAHVILFDTDPAAIKLPFTIPPFQVQEFADMTVMLAPSLSALNKNDNEGKLLKTRLWNSLKKMFNIS